MTLQETFLAIGIKPKELSHHNSDLHVIKNSISDRIIREYAYTRVTTFVSETPPKVVWYNIPYAYVEHFKKEAK